MGQFNGKRIRKIRKESPGVFFGDEGVPSTYLGFRECLKPSLGQVRRDFNGFYGDIEM